MTDLNPEMLVNEHCGTGENPLWDDERGLLYWCDIPGGKIFALDLASGNHRTIHDGAGKECGAFTLQNDGKLLLLFTGEAALLDPDSGELTPIVRPNIVNDTGRFNDCIADPMGRIFAGTVDWDLKVRGALFRLDFNLDSTLIYSGTACANGYGFTPNLKGLYWADTTAKTVYLFDYERETGELSNRRVWLHTPDLSPDGLTVDAAGNLWIAFYDGGFVRHYNDSAQMLVEVDIPVKNVTSCIFGGENLDQLFITTAGGKPDDDSLAGALFRIRPEIGGPKRFRSKIVV
jgi:D-xylonolactonase